MKEQVNVQSVPSAAGCFASAELLVIFRITLANVDFNPLCTACLCGPCAVIVKSG